MKWLFKLAPVQLKQLDTFLRINYAWIWATRIHLTVYSSLLLIVLGLILGNLFPVELREITTEREIESIFGYLVIPSVLLMGFIIFQICIYNINKEHSNNSPFTSVLVLIFTFISILSPFTLPFTSAIVLNNRVSKIIPDQEYIQDRNEFLKARFFVNEGEYSYSYFESDSAYFNSFVPKKYRESSSYIEEVEYQTDSAEIYKDSIFYHKGIYKDARPRLYKTTAYNNARFWLRSENTTHTTWGTSIPDSLFKKYYIFNNTHFNKDSCRHHLTAVNRLMNKYSIKAEFNVDSAVFDLTQNNYVGYRHREWKRTNPNRGQSESVVYYYGENHSVFDETGDNLLEIKKAKNSTLPGDTEGFLMFFTYMSFVLSVLVLLFKMINWKQLLLNLLLSGILIAVFAVFEAIYRFRGDLIATASLSTILLCLFLTILVWRKSRYYWTLNQTTILAYLFSAHVFLIAILYMDEVWNFWEWRYFDTYKVQYFHEDGSGPFTRYSLAHDTLKERTIWACHFGGIAFFTLVAVPYFHKTFKRLQVLPKKK